MPRPKQIREIVAAFKAQEIEKPSLYRALMHHARWRVAGEERADQLRFGFLVREDGGRILEIFSDSHALKTFEEKGGELSERRLVMSGHKIFSALTASMVDRINVDPLSPQTCHFLSDQLPMLGVWAAVAALEEALATPERFVDPVAQLARFENYHVVVRASGDAHDFVLAPDSHDRPLAAIFTSEDVATEFVTALGLPSATIVRQPARPLFESLEKMGLVGMVFNPMTSLPPRALSATLITKILERIGEE